MKNLRKKFELFCFKNRNKGIPNLMLYIVIGTAVVYLFSQMSGNALLYSALRFDRTSILQGQVWRLITYPLTTLSSNILFMLITLLCYYSLGTAMERQWGTLKFNLFYLSGVVLMDVYGMLFNCQADVYYLNMSLFLGYATLYPQAQFLLFFIIPIKMKYMALFSGALCLIDLLMGGWSTRAAVLLSLANFLLFFGGDFFRTVKQEIKYHKTRRTWQNQNRSNWR